MSVKKKLWRKTEEPQLLFSLKIKVNAKNVSYVNKILWCTVYSYYLTFQLSSYVLIERSCSFTAALKVCLHSVETSYNNTPQWKTVSFSAAVTQGDYFLAFLHIVEQHFHCKSYTSLAIPVINFSCTVLWTPQAVQSYPEQVGLFSEIWQ